MYMKIGRFTLFFGALVILLSACANATGTAGTNSTEVSPGDSSASGPMGGAPVQSLTQPAPVPTDDNAPITFPANTPILIWHRQGGIAGFCNTVTVFASGAYTVANCATNSSQTGQLNADQLAQLTRFVNKVQSFTNENSDPANVADAMSVKTTFKGVGRLEASPEDITTLSNFAVLLALQVAPPVGAGGYPVAVSKARDFLAAELSLPADEIQFISVEAAEWPDRCLGVVTIGMMCAQGITPGYRVVLQAQGQRYELHTDESGESVRLVK